MIQSIPMITKKINLIGICGKAGSGKDTAGSYLSEKYADTWCDWFAWPIKQAACDAFGIPEEHFNQRDIKELVNPYWGVSPRKIAQFMGTEMFRDVMVKLIPDIGSNFWVKRFAGKVNGDLDINGTDYRDGETIILCDVRFQNEVDFIEANGGLIIHLTGKELGTEGGIVNHVSEKFELTTNERNYSVLNNQSFEYLYNQLDNIMKQEFPQVEKKSANGMVF